MALQPLELLMSQIEEERKLIIEDIGDGKAQDYAQYKFSAGIVRGLMMAQRLTIDLAKRLEGNDDE